MVHWNNIEPEWWKQGGRKYYLMMGLSGRWLSWELYDDDVHDGGASRPSFAAVVVQRQERKIPTGRPVDDDRKSIHLWDGRRIVERSPDDDDVAAADVDVVVVVVDDEKRLNLLLGRNGTSYSGIVDGS